MVAPALIAPLPPTAIEPLIELPPFPPDPPTDWAKIPLAFFPVVESIELLVTDTFDPDPPRPPSPPSVTPRFSAPLPPDT